MTKTTEDYRLPYDASPRRYELVFAPDLEGARFVGEERVEIDVHVPTDRIVMNAVELDIRDATIAGGDGIALELRVEYDQATERVAFVAQNELREGRYVLSCAFDGELNDKLCGFYRSRYFDDAGVEHVIATTQFEATDARRAFPCFDEPDRKAVFSVTLDAPAGMLAISNSSEIGTEDLGHGRRRVHFADTIVMSTYLVCFIVGPLEATEPVDVDGVALRVVHVPGKADLTGPAIDVARHALGFYAKYFDLAYPGSKLDLVAIPDFAAGAMENLGCVTFRDAILLADPENTAQLELVRLAEVVEHELAHMWFGDLVTMAWWNGIWLNEAFATYMALCCQDDYRPEWRCFAAFARGKSQALATDGLHATRPIEFPVRNPEESSAMFDVLTYEKGASVLWMIDAFLGDHRFRDGVRRYLAAHQYGNTETSDLWEAIAAEAPDIPIRDVMDSWIFQGGYPLIGATFLNAESAPPLIGMRQEPFAYLPVEEAELKESAIGKDWLVPVLSASVAPRAPAVRSLLGPKFLSVECSTSPVVLNAGAAGFYRVHYDNVLRAKLLDVFSYLDPAERYSFTADTWAVILAGHAQLDEFFAIAAHLSQERDPHVWSIAIGALGLMDLIAPLSLQGELASFVRSLLLPQLVSLGWDAKPNEDDQTPILRSSLITALGTFGHDTETINHARELFNVDHTNDEVIDANLTTPVLNVVAANASRHEFEAILERHRHPRSPLDEFRHLNALGALTNVEFANDVHRLCLSEIRSQNAPYLLGSMIRSRSIGPSTWKFVSERFGELVERFPESSISRMLEGVVGLAFLDESGAPVYLDEVRAFVSTHIEGGRRRLVAQSVERLNVNVRFAKVVRTVLPTLLKEARASGPKK